MGKGKDEKIGISGEKKIYLDLIYNEPYKIGHWLGFKDLIPLNNEWIRSFVFGTKDQTLQAHRGSFKTTCLSLAIIFIMILFPHLNILFFRKTDTDVSEIIWQVGKAMKSVVIRKIVKVLYGVDLELTKETSSEINTNLKQGSKGASQLVGLGIKTSVTGKHADIIMTDDIVNINDRVSRAERERIKKMYMELQNVKNRGGRFINTGTPWHKEDAFSLMPNISKYDCYTTGMIDKGELAEIRKKMTPALFAANYELKHIAETNMLFGPPLFYNGTVEDIHNGIGHIDAAYGGGDYTAFGVMKKLNSRFITFGKLWDKHVDDCLDAIVGYCKFYRIGTIHCERNADKGYLAKELATRGINVSTYHEDMNKFIKISTYGRTYWPQIEFVEGTDPEYINQILEYTETAENDDAPDNLACMVRQYTGKKIIVNLYKGGI